MSDRRSSAATGAATTLRAALDVLVFAPLGLGAKLVDDAPQAVELARQELSNARFIGRLTVTQGVAQMREQLAADEPAPSPSAEGARTIDEASSSDDQPMVEDPAGDDPIGASVDGVVPGVDDLALPDYEHLPAIDIVAKLPTLDANDREAIRRYETAHRQRRTVLGKLDQLADTL